MVLFFKQLRCFLIYSFFFVAVLLIVFVKPYGGKVELIEEMIIHSYVVLINPVIIWIIGGQTQKKYHMNKNRIILLSLIVFLITLGIFITLKFSDFSDKLVYSNVLYLSPVPPCLFGISAIVNSKSVNEKNQKGIAIFFKQCSFFLIYTCFFTVFLYSNFVYPIGDGEIAKAMFFYFYIVIIHPIIVGVIGFITQNRYQMSDERIMEISLTILVVTLATIIIIKQAYTSIGYNYAQFLIISAITACIFAVTAKITKKVNGEKLRISQKNLLRHNI